MPFLPELADRAWYALHSLPRKSNGEPPSYRQLERDFDLHFAVLSKTMLGKQQQFEGETFRRLAKALRVSEKWLEQGGKGAPTPTGVVPPRPGRKWMRHGDHSAWQTGVEAALENPQQYVPPAAFRAGAELPMYKPVDTITPEIAIGAAWYAWATCDADEQTFYSTEEAKLASPGRLARPRSIQKRGAK